MMKTKRLTALSLLTSLALVIFVIEAQLPPLAPIPGIKIGLANVITLITMKWYGRKDAFFVLILRIVIGAVFAGRVVSMLYSMSGGLLCYAVMAVFVTKFHDKQLWAVSIIGAIAHNAGQIAAAIVITRTFAVTAYFPILIVSGIITGAFTGCIASLIVNNKTLKGRLH